MICRQIILNVVILGYDHFIPLNWLLVTCMVISLIHWLVRPYGNKVLNAYDGLVLQTMTAIIALQIIYFDNFDSVVPIAASFILVILTITMFLIMAPYLSAEHIKFYVACFVALKLMKKKETCHNQIANSSKEYDVTVDHELQKNQQLLCMLL